MSSTSGLVAGDLANEVRRLRRLLRNHRRDLDRARASRDYWKQRAAAAEWANRQLAPISRSAPPA